MAEAAPLQEWQQNTLTHKQRADMLLARHYLNEERYLCASRPQYATNCGIASLTGCWNYLFSTLGHGQQAPLSQEEALSALGYGTSKPFDKESFNPGNGQIFQWFQALCRARGVQGRYRILWKRREGSGAIVDYASEQEVAQLLKKVLHSRKHALIYHCFNHYLIPAGYQEDVLEASQMYERDAPCELSLLLADTSQQVPFVPICSVKLQDVNTDLGMRYPEQISIRALRKGIQLSQKPQFNQGGMYYQQNFHCIMLFESQEDQQQATPQSVCEMN